MKNKKIFKKLRELGVDEMEIAVLEMQASLVGNITIILSMAKVINNYNSTQENEDKVCNLLALLSKNHFKDVKNNQ